MILSQEFVPPAKMLMGSLTNKREFIRVHSFLFVVVGFLVSSVADAAPIKFDLLKAGSHTYTNVTVVGFNATEIYIKHDGGLADLKLRNLEPEVQKRFNYDPQRAEAAESGKAEDDARYMATLASNSVARATKKVTASSPENLADPVSEKSLIGKPLPSFKSAKWLGAKPALEGKVVLVAFWGTWSVPCRKYISQWNSAQKKFGEKIVVLGVSSEPEQDAMAMADPKVEFPVALDTDGSFSREMGVTSIPYVLVVDRKGIVRYQGHPAAVTEKELERWVGMTE
ncbi:MAG: hypothetical protein C5B50_01625 [Verrucomicrobia bacterium]|nr:MAG: hypothetical protein C5B50_01625 [Verrucomicrobiota bacterium]